VLKYRVVFFPSFPLTTGQEYRQNYTRDVRERDRQESDCRLLLIDIQKTKQTETKREANSNQVIYGNENEKGNEQTR
jgi:hypothetical protein